MKNKDLAKAEEQFEKFRARVEKKHAFDATLIAQFCFPINLIKEDYVQRAKFIDEHLDKKLQEPLSKQAYFSRPENLEPYARARGENTVVVERLIELKRRNQEDMQIILKSRAGIQDDQAEDKATEKL